MDHYFLGRSAVFKCLIRSSRVVVMDKGSELALYPDPPAHPGLMKPIDPHRKRLQPLPDETPITVVQVIVEIAPRQSGQVAYAIDGKRVSEKSWFSTSRPRNAAAGSVPHRLEIRTPSTSFVSISIVAYSHCCSVPIVTAVSSTVTHSWCARSGSGVCSAPLGDAIGTPLDMSDYRRTAQERQLSFEARYLSNEVTRRAPTEYSQCSHRSSTQVVRTPGRL